MRHIFLWKGLTPPYCSRVVVTTTILLEDGRSTLFNEHRAEMRQAQRVSTLFFASTVLYTYIHITAYSTVMLSHYILYI